MAHVLPTDKLYSGLTWELYKEHVKKFSHAAVKGMPTEQEMKEDLAALVEAATVKVLAQERVGMVVTFHWMDTFPALEVCDITDVKGFLTQRYGGGKFKLNLYHGINFLSTKNWETEGPPKWKDMIRGPEEG
ncbi:MAG TPA: hypothetical protein VFN94_10505 [Nitrospiria bacterium]|nr:hypothetical protein [Nitrospiria bacterium]